MLAEILRQHATVLSDSEINVLLRHQDTFQAWQVVSLLLAPPTQLAERTAWIETMAENLDTLKQERGQAMPEAMRQVMMQALRPNLNHQPTIAPEADTPQTWETLLGQQLDPNARRREEFLAYFQGIVDFFLLDVNSELADKPNKSEQEYLAGLGQILSVPTKIVLKTANQLAFPQNRNYLASLFSLARCWKHNTTPISMTEINMLVSDLIVKYQYSRPSIQLLQPVVEVANPVNTTA